MKFGCGVLIFLFVFICLQLQHSEAVKCPFNRHNLNETKECSACAVVVCGFDGNVTHGCSSDDLFKKCPKKYDNDIDFIKRRSIKFYKNDTFEYFSGCSGAVNGTKCMQDEVCLIL
uniref:Uncharacterized protein n=1 Tax=Panagrolaimus superbus TaxID=310955 RepID=A0A914YBA9_9BILA